MCEFLSAAGRWFEDAAGETIDQPLIDRFTERTVELVLRGIAAHTDEPLRRSRS